MRGLIKKILREQEREKMQTVSLPASDPWPEFRKQNAKRFKDMIDAADWELFLHGLEIPEEESEEPQVIKDLNALVKAIEEGKKDNYLMRTKNFKRLNLDKDKLTFWRNHLNKPEVQSVWARAKGKIQKWLDGVEGDVASKKETKKDIELNEVGFTTDYSQEVLNELDSFIDVVKGPISDLRNQKSFPSELNTHLIQRLYGLLSEGGELHAPTQELIDILSELDDKPERKPIGFRTGGNY